MAGREGGRAPAGRNLQHCVFTGFARGRSLFSFVGGVNTPNSLRSLSLGEPGACMGEPGASLEEPGAFFYKRQRQIPPIKVPFRAGKLSPLNPLFRVRNGGPHIFFSPIDPSIGFLDLFTLFLRFADFLYGGEGGRAPAGRNLQHCVFTGFSCVGGVNTL